MRLIVGGNTVTDQADDAAIRTAIRSLLDKGEDDKPFAILVDGPNPEDSQHYIQTLFCPAEPGSEDEDDGFVLEYREGSSDQHYQCLTASLGEVTEAFIDYLHAGKDWRTLYNWEHYPE